MPRLIVLFFGPESGAEALAEAAAEGATGVRFTEVDLRGVAAHRASSSAAHKSLDSSIQVRDYDGVILAWPPTAETPVELSRTLDEMQSEAADAFTNTVFGVAGGEDSIALYRVARLGGVLVTEPRATGDGRRTTGGGRPALQPLTPRTRR